MIGSVQKALKILIAISDGKNTPVSLADLSVKTGINKSTCSHIVSTLAKEGFVKRISHTQGYVLGPEAYCLSRFGKYDNEFVSLCRPVIDWLYKQTNCAIILAVTQAGKKFTIDHIDTPIKTLTNSYEIMPDDIYRTATGRIIMANMNSDEIKEVFDKNGLPPEKHWDEITSLDALKNELSKINKRGVLKTVHFNSDTCNIGYAAAIYKHTRCVGAIGIALQTTKSELHNLLKKEQSLTKHLLAARTEIGRRLRYS